MAGPFPDGDVELPLALTCHLFLLIQVGVRGVIFAGGQFGGFLGAEASDVVAPARSASKGPSNHRPSSRAAMAEDCAVGAWQRN
jgi:hypothetical protein